MNARKVCFRSAATLAVVTLFALIGSGPAAAQQEYSIWDIQRGNVPENTLCYLDSVVVTGVGLYGYCVQEPTLNPQNPEWGRRWSALWIYTAQNHTFTRGDFVTIQGVYKEYRNNSELDLPAAGLQAIQFKIGTHPLPPPESVRIAEVNSLGAEAEAYENVIVRVDRDDPTVYAGASELSYPYEWPLHTTPTGGDTLVMYHEAYRIGADFEYDAPDSGTVLSFAQGMLHQYYETYELAPRNCEEDLGGVCRPKLRGAYATSATNIDVRYGVDLNEAVAENPANYELLGSGAPVLSAELDPANPRLIHLTTAPLPNGDPEQLVVHTMVSAAGQVAAPDESFEFRSGITPIYNIQYVANPAVNERSSLEGEIVTVEGRVTALDGSYYYLQDDNGGAWDGLYCRVARSGILRVGDKVQVTGRVVEYSPTGSFYTTELGYQAGCENYQWLGISPIPVNTVTVTATQVPIQGYTGEPFEDCLVKLPSATMLDSIAGVPGPYFGEWRLKQAAFPDTAGMDLNGINPTSYDACAGNIITLTGILRVYFTTSGYRIAPRTGRGNDIVEIYHVPDCAQNDVEEEAVAGGLELRQNAPNPFHGGTAIGFQLPRAARVRLEVLDVSGRLVRELETSLLAAGPHRYAWDARNQAGQPVAAGAYFYRLRVDGAEMSRKMILLK